MLRTIHVVKNERGGGLLMALLVIVALAAIAAGIMSTVSTDRRLTSYNMARAQALNYAEAGVAEALERIRTNEVPNKIDPKMVSQIFLTTPGNVPAVGTDTVGMATAQPTGAWLPYSSESKGPDVLTVQFMTNAARTGVYYYDASKSPAIQGLTGDPIYLIRSPARFGSTRRQVDAAVSKISIKPNLKGAYVGEREVKFSGINTLNGYDYSVDTPSGTCADGKRATAWETGKPIVAGAWSGKNVSLGGNAVAYGSPAKAENQSGFYAGPWEVLNMSQAQFYSWVGPPLWSGKKTTGPLPSGITYLGDPHDKPQKGKRKFKFTGGSADGLLYVNGNLEIAGDFVFRGLIYVEGHVEFKGTGWVLGSIVVADKANAKKSHHEQLTVLKSIDAVQQFIAKSGSPFVTISWRES